MSYKPSSVDPNYVTFNQVFRIHPNDPEYAVINLRSIAHFLVASDLHTRIERWLRVPGNNPQLVIHLGGRYRHGNPGQFRTVMRGQQILTALVIQAMGDRNHELCDYCKSASTSARMKPAFTGCISDRSSIEHKAGGLGACSNCVWNHKEA